MAWVSGVGHTWAHGKDEVQWGVARLAKLSDRGTRVGQAPHQKTPGRDTRHDLFLYFDHDS
jgi:hypothetical protein